MTFRRGEIWWASLRVPRGSEPGYHRPVLIIQAEPFNRTNIRTVIVATLTSNEKAAYAKGNVRISRRHTGLSKNSVVNVSQLFTMDKDDLTQRIGQISPAKQREIDDGLRLVLGL